MKKEINASKSFVEGLAEAGLDAMTAFGKSVREVGIDLENDEKPLQVAANALLRFERAHVQFIQGALHAASAAVETARNPARPETEVRKPTFHLERMNTLMLTGTADYACVARLLADSGFTPASLDWDGQQYGIVDIYFNDVANGDFGPCREMLVTVAASPAERPIALQGDLFVNPYFVLAPGFDRSSVLFAIKMLVAGPDDDIRFGREKLALDKVGQPMPDVLVGKDGASLDIAGIVTGHLELDKVKADEALAHFANALGKTTRDVMRMHPPDHFRIAARNEEHPAVMRWAWVLDKSSLPRMHPVADDVLTVQNTPGMGALLTEMGFRAKVATWTFGVDAHLEWPVAAP